MTTPTKIRRRREIRGWWGTPDARKEFVLDLIDKIGKKRDKLGHPNRTKMDEYTEGVWLGLNSAMKILEDENE